MLPIKLSERERLLLIVTTACVLFYTFYHFLLTPKWNEVNQLKEKARSQRMELNLREGKIKILSSVGKPLGFVSGKSAGTPDKRALEALKIISQASAQAGLSLNSIRPPLDSGGEGLKFTLSCSGKYAELYDFLKTLSQSRVVIIVDSLDVTGDGSKDPSLNIQINLTAY